MNFETEPITTIKKFASHYHNEPTFVFRPHTLKLAVDTFLKQFIGKILFAVKTNPEPFILKTLYHYGVKCFDVASLGEIALLRELLPESQLFFMHPVKSRHAIRAAYFDYGIRHFSLDSECELQKILQETADAKDLHLFLRIKINHTSSEINLSKKFGLSTQLAPSFLKRMRAKSEKLGICFHVGSQCMQPETYERAIRTAMDIIKLAAVPVDYFNIGGGFPSIYTDLRPPPLNDFFQTIQQTLADYPSSFELLAEPGRALVAESMSLITQVILRKKQNLYINDGVYGGLFDAGILKLKLPVRMINSRNSTLLPFNFFGPTCDSLDFIPGPYYLPYNINEGDLLEIGQVGAYSKALNSNFNGFKHSENTSMVSDLPLLSLYHLPMTAKQQIMTA